MIANTISNGDLTSVFIDNNNTTQLSKGNRLLWLQWSMEASDGSGEHRDLALLRLIACEESGSYSLDLSGLGLTSLPDNLPQHITELNASDNKLTLLPENLPPDLRVIELNNNPLPDATRDILQDKTDAGIHSSPESVLLPEDAPPGEDCVLVMDEEDYQLSGRQLRLEAEKLRRVRDNAQQPTRRSMCWKAGGVLFGLGMLSSIGLYVSHRLRNGEAHAPEDNDLMLASGNDLRDSAQSLAYQASPWSEAPGETPTPGGFSSTPALTTLPPLTETQAIELELTEYLRAEDGLFKGGQPRKEALVAGVAHWLFPQGAPYESETRVKSMARAILRASGHYGGKKDEALSFQTARGVIRQWVFKTILQAPLREYVANKIINDKHPTYFTPDSLKHLLSLPRLHLDGLLFINNVPAPLWGNLNAMWHAFIREEIPLLDEQLFKDYTKEPLANFDTLALATGAEYLADRELLQKFTPQEIITIGATIWGNMLSQGANMDMLPYLITPSLWHAAQTNPNSLKKTLADKETYYAQPVVTSALENWRSAQARAKKLEDTFSGWQKAQREWRSKGDLAEEVIANCDINDIMYIHDAKYDIDDVAERHRKIREHAKERYLLWGTPPCKGVTTDLKAEYSRLTTNVADAYKKLDTILLQSTLSAADKADHDFIFSPESSIHPAFLHMRTHRTIASFPGGNFVANDIFIEQNNADLFAVRKNNEERIYALKRGDDINSGYTLHRLDKDFAAYVNHNILSNSNLWKKYRIEDGKVHAGGYEFSFSIGINPQTKLSGKNEQGDNLLIENLSQQHRNKIYDALYQKGNDQSKTMTLLNTLKHIVPFYDCVEGVSSGNSLQIAEAIPSCFLDALALVPGVGQAAALSGKFGAQLVRGMRRGILGISRGVSSKELARALAKGVELPTRTEVRKAIATTLKAFDPGFEPLYTANARSGLAGVTVSDAKLAEKLQQHLPAKTAAQGAEYKTATLPTGGQPVSIKPAGKNSWVRVNPRTGEAFGKYYHLQDGALSEAEIRYKRPRTRTMSNSKTKRSKTDQPLIAKKHNQLPPAPGKADYWNAVLGIEKRPSQPLPDITPHTTLQKLDRFVPELPLMKGSVESATQVATEAATMFLAPHPWRAFAGTSTAVSGEVPAYMVPMQAELASGIAESIQTFGTMRDKLWQLKDKGPDALMASDIGQYLAGTLNSYDPQVIQEGAQRLTSIVERGDAFLRASGENNYENFIIISTELLPDPNDPQKYISPITSDRLAEIPVAFVAIPDPEARVFIYGDRYQNNGRTSKMRDTGASINISPRLSDDLNHEITHMSGATADIFSYNYPPEGTLNNGDTLMRMFLGNFNPADADSNVPMLFEQTGFCLFLDNLMDHQGISGSIPREAVITALNNDPMLFANALMSDAEVVATIMRDVTAGRTYDAEIRLKRDAEAAAQAKKSDLLTLFVGRAMNRGNKKAQRKA